MASAVFLCLLLAKSSSGSSTQHPALKHANQSEITVTPEDILLEAAAKGDCVMTGYAIGQNASVDCRDSSGRTPLMLAAQNGHTDTAVVLLQNKADWDLTDSLHNRALSLAAGNGHLDTVRMLLRYGAKIDSGAGEGETALIAACKNGKSAVVEYLLENKAALWPGRSFGRGALTVSLHNSHIDCAEILLRFGADVNETDAQGNNVLMMAILCNSPELVKLLLEKYPLDKTHHNNAGENALQTARKLNNKAVIRLIEEFLNDL